MPDKDKLKQLEGLLLRGQKLMDRYYPKYQPRTTDVGYFELAIGSQKHQKLYSIWNAKVVDILEFGISDDYYTAKFKRAKPAKNIHLLAPDGFYHGLEALEEIIRDLRVIHNKNSGVELSDAQEEISVLIDYKSPNILLIVDEDNQYVLHTFRRGKPKTILEYSLKQPEGIAYKSAFRAGGLGGANIKEPFRIVFRQLQKEPFTLKPLVEAIDIRESSFRLNRRPVVMKRHELKKITRALRKLE